MATRRLRIILWAVGLFAVAAVLFTATLAFIIFRTIESMPATPPTAAQAFDEVRRMYPGRPPLIEVVNLRTGNVKINRTPAAPRKRVETIHFMVWNAEDQKIFRGHAPAWVARLRVGLTGVGEISFSDLHVTMEDIERYAPGILIDFKSPDGEQLLAWVR